MSLVTFLLYMLVAVIGARLAARVVASTWPGGFTTPVLISLVGAYYGPTYIGSYGPTLEGVCVLSSMIGAIILVMVVSYLGRLVHKSA